MRHIFLGLFFLAACSDGNESGSPRDRSGSPIDALDDAGTTPTDTPPGNQGGDGGSRPPTGDGSRPPADGSAGDGKDGAPPVPPGELGPDYRELGSLAVTQKMDSFTGDTCTFAYESFTPASTRTEAAVVIAPGFALFPGAGSSREALQTLAKHVASWGVTTLTVDLCTNGGSIDHAKNGAAIAEFGAKVGGERVVYAGFSAGGLGSLLAAAQATNTEAFLALDAVDTNDLAKGALDALTKPIYAMAGEPSMCNSDGNMLAQYKGRMLRVVKVNKAQHFTFEGAPCQGFKCSLCPGGGEVEAAAIRALATSYVLGITGVEANALSWWQEGSAGFTALMADGVVGVQ